MKILFFILLLPIFSCQTESQQSKIVRQEQNIPNYKTILLNLKKENQKKLDTGKFMWETERKFQYACDSIMNEIYSTILIQNPINKKEIITDQIKFNHNLQKFSDSLYNLQEKTRKKSGFVGFDERLVTYGLIADKLFERALDLTTNLH